MIIDGWGWVFIAGVAATLVSMGGLMSSLFNRRLLHRLNAKIDHNTKNAKMVQQALARREAREQATEREP